MDHRPPKAQRSVTSAPTPLGARGPTQMAALVKIRLAEDPQWGYFALNGKWICPFCLSPVTRRQGRSREDSIAVHLEGCRAYHGGRGTVQAAEIIARRQQFENLVHLADTDPAWRVYDPTGCWFCPACLERVPSVRTQGQQLSSFVYQAMADHLGRCAAYLKGARPNAEDIQRARDRAARLPALLAFLREQLQFPVWRYLDPNGVWVCPCCLTHVQHLRVTNDADWQRAHEGMAQHLISQCQAYAQSPNQTRGEAEVRQAATVAGTSTPYRTPAPGAAGNHMPVARPATSGGFGTVSGISRILTPRPPDSPPVARPSTPNATRGVPSSRPTLGSLSPMQRLKDPTPAASPIIARPSTPIASPVAPPPPPPAPLPSPPTKDDTLFGKLKEDFLNDTPLGAMRDTPADADSDANADEDPNGLNWMDEVDAKSPLERELPAGERTDMIKARAVQQGLMQKPPEVPGFRFATSFESCTDISGDFYQFIRLPDGRVGFALGDVSGHGVHAGLIMSMAKKTFEIYASTGLGPADCLAKVNDAIARDLGGKLFISMVYALLDPTERTVTWARAGHNPSLRFNLDNSEIEEIKPPGMVVGMKVGEIFRKSMQEQVTQLRKGDLILLYTDGVTETMNLQQEEFGPERLIDVVKKFKPEGPEILTNRIMEIIRHFRGPQPPSDDSTLVLLAVD